jgi:hypothetical protein
MVYGFDQQLGVSKGARLATDTATIQSMIAGCVCVKTVTDIGMDKLGVDFVATLRGGAEVYIDAKCRTAGCSRYWRGEPEVAIEKWSVMPGGKFGTSQQAARTGWTLDEGKITDLVLYTFDPTDCPVAYLLPFQHLRMAARRRINEWMREHKDDIQQSSEGGRHWQSQAVFVPVSKVVAAIEETFSREIYKAKTEGAQLTLVL